MTPKLSSRKIGEVNIVEIQGVLAGAGVRKVKEMMKNVLETNSAEGLLFNMREVEKVDDSGAEAILEVVRKPSKAGIFGHNLSAYFIAEHMTPNEPIPIFEKACEVIGYFAEEFVRGKQALPEERRRFSRTVTALPGKFQLEEFGRSFLLEAAVTNLSEGGLYGYFLDSATEELAQRILDPFDLKMMKIYLVLGGKVEIETEGKVLRSGTDFSQSHGLAVEFYNLRSEDEQEIREFLKGRVRA